METSNPWAHPLSCPPNELMNRRARTEFQHFSAQLQKSINVCFRRVPRVQESISFGPHACKSFRIVEKVVEMLLNVGHLPFRRDVCDSRFGKTRKPTVARDYRRQSMRPDSQLAPGSFTTRVPQIYDQVGRS